MEGFKKVGEKIKYYREKKGFSIQLLAKRTYMTAGKLEEIENGKIVFIPDTGPGFGLGNTGPPILMPFQPYLFDVVQAGASPGDAVFYQILNEIHGKMQSVIEVKDPVGVGGA